MELIREDVVQAVLDAIALTEGYLVYAQYGYSNPVYLERMS
jgi:hypothetical protein